MLGFRIGESVVCHFARYEGRPATVVRLNPADLEIGVVLNGGTGRVLWARGYELQRASDTA